MSNKWGFDWKDIALVIAAAAIQIINVVVVHGVGATSVILVVIVCTRWVNRNLVATVEPAYRMGERHAQRRLGGRLLSAVEDDVPRGSRR